MAQPQTIQSGSGSKPTGWRTALMHGASAAALALFCYSTVKCIPSLREPYWAPISAVVVIYPDRESTRKAGVQRVLGTLIGSLVGWGTAASWNGHLLVYGLAVCFAVCLCDLLRLESASRLCAVAVTVITIIPRDEPPRWIALHRFIEVTYGVLCALFLMSLLERLEKRVSKHNPRPQ